MGKKKQTAVEDLLIPPQDNRICGTICVCQMTLILSCVALVYLTVAVYVPAYKILTSGIEDNPVMCTTTRIAQVDMCNKTTCSEWCLSKGTGSCRQIFVHLRNNGSTIQFQNCKNFANKTCTGLDMETATNATCKAKECANLTGIYNCTKGACFDITEIFDCNFEHLDPVVKCSARRGHVACREIHGLYKCDNGSCARARTPYNCDRLCKNVTTYNRNVILLNGDLVHLAKCLVAVNVDTGKEVWRESDGSSVLMTSCYGVNVQSDQKVIDAVDCINGSLLTNKSLLNDLANFTELINLHLFNATPDYSIAPLDADLTIGNDSLLMINLEGCVNTLRDDCKKFFKKYARDGSDHNARARFPCFYSPHNTSIAVQHYDLEVEYQQFMVGFIIPVALFIISCTVLTICQRVVVVGDDSKMRFKCAITDENEGKLHASGGGHHHHHHKKSSEAL